MRNSENVPPWTWAWTPPGSDELGAVGLQVPPIGPMTRQRYRAALMDKIERMAAREGLSKLSFLARSIYAHEGLDVIDRPALIAEVLESREDGSDLSCAAVRSGLALR